MNNKSEVQRSNAQVVVSLEQRGFVLDNTKFAFLAAPPGFETFSPCNDNEMPIFTVKGGSTSICSFSLDQFYASKTQIRRLTEMLQRVDCIMNQELQDTKFLTTARTKCR